MLPLKTAFALANHVRDVPIFLQIGIYTGILCSGPWLVKKPIVHFPQLPSPLVPTPEEGMRLTYTETSWDGQASSSPAWTCTCDYDRKIKIPPSSSARRDSRCVCIPKMQARKG